MRRNNFEFCSLGLFGSLIIWRKWVFCGVSWKRLWLGWAEKEWREKSCGLFQSTVPALAKRYWWIHEKCQVITTPPPPPPANSVSAECSSGQLNTVQPYFIFSCRYARTDTKSYVLNVPARILNVIVHLPKGKIFYINIVWSGPLVSLIMNCTLLIFWF